MGQKRSVRDPTEHPKGPQRSPQKQRITTVGWPLLGAPGRAQGTPREARRHPWGTEGTAKTAPNKNPKPLNKKGRGQEKDNKKDTTNLIVIYKGFALMPIGVVFAGDAAARRKLKNMRCTAVLDPRGCQNTRKPYILQSILNTHLSRRRHSARLSVVFRRLVLPWPPAPASRNS